MACAICEIRRPRRFCPGVRGDICAICCGTEREVTVSCPLDCEYLREARRHEKPAPLDDASIPHKDVAVTEKFLLDHERVLMLVGHALLDASADVEAAIDYDVRAALDSLVRTYRTLQSGLVYESLPANPLAAQVHRAVQDGIDEFRREEIERDGMAQTRDSDLLGVLAFLQRLELTYNNGRKRGRAFIDFLRDFYAPAAVAPEASKAGLILP